MELVPVDLLTAGLFVALLLGACVAVLFLLRDTTSVPPHRVSQTLWCAARQQNAVVDFVERTQEGLAVRSVERCSLRRAGEQCGEECRDRRLSPERPVHPGFSTA